MKTLFCSILLAASLAAPAAAQSPPLTPETAAPYVGLYWFEPKQKALFVVLETGRLALEIPERGLLELEKTTAKETWAYIKNPENLVIFHRDGAGPATSMELRQEKTITLARFAPEKGLPSLDELFARRPDRERAKKLAELGTIRANGSIERSTTPEKGSFERLWAGEDRTFLQLKMGDRESRQLQSGNRAWMLAADSAPKEMPEAKARVALLSGWLLVTGDWRKEFAQAQVLKRIELDGKPAFLVHAGPGSGRQRLIYVDAESGLTLGYDEVVELPGMGMIGRENRFADFRDVEGAQIPFRKTEKYSNPKLGSWTFQVEKIETRVKLDTDPFTIK